MVLSIKWNFQRIISPPLKIRHSDYCIYNFLKKVINYFFPTKTHVDEIFDFPKPVPVVPKNLHKYHIFVLKLHKQLLQNAR